jgi:hypothetical protein
VRKLTKFYSAKEIYFQPVGSKLKENAGSAA